MTAPPATRRRRRVAVWSLAALSVVLVVAAGVVWFVPSRMLPWDTEVFPSVDTAQLSPAQARVVDVLHQEYDRQRPGTFYSQGVDEEWCADFVSWVMREAGQPLVNPNSGGWRIPGVYTLQEYYRSHGRFESRGDGYRPRTGDVVLYDGPSFIGQHTNVIVAVDGDTATTVGGNEFGAIRVHTVKWSSDPGVLGFGRLA